MGTLWPRVERKERKTRGEREREKEKDTGAEKDRERRRRRERDTERERSRASCSHYLTYYTGSMPPRPVPRPHFTSLGFTWLSLRASHRLALRLLVLPPSRRAPPPSSHTRPPFAPSSPSLPARARSPPSAPRLPSPSLSAAPLARLDLTLSSPPTPFSSCSSAPCSSSSAPTKHSHRPFVHKSTEKRFFVSSRLVSSPSTRFAPFSPFPRLLLPLSSFFLPCSPSAASSSFVLLPVPRAPRSPSTPPPPAPCPRARRGINYSKNLYCYYYRLTIPNVGEPETSTRVQYNARLCSRPADYVNSTTARAATATTSRERLVSLW